MMSKNNFNRHHYGKGIDYGAISNIEELRAARMQLRRSIELKEAALSKDVEAFKEAINPVTYLNRFITKLYSMEYFMQYFIKGYNWVKTQFNHSPETGIKEPDIKEPGIKEPNSPIEQTESPK